VTGACVTTGACATGEALAGGAEGTGDGGVVLTTGVTGLSETGAAGAVREGTGLGTGGATGAGGRVTGAGGLASVGGGIVGRAGGAGVGVEAACCLLMIAFSTSPGLEMCERSILVLIPSGSGRAERALLEALWPSPLA
jgi:hypothetical protein